MSKKKDRQNFKSPTVKQPVPQVPLLSKRGWLGLGGGGFLLLIGFITLSFTDAGGGNLASDLSPLFLLAGYAVMAYFLWSGSPRNDKM